MTPTGFSLVKTKPGFARPKITDEALVRVPRSEIVGAELHRAKPHWILIVSFSDGNMWELELAKVELKTATATVQARRPRPKPTDLSVPAGGPRSTVCLEAHVVNGAGVSIVDIDVVGYLT